VKAVNLIPADNRRNRGSVKVGALGPAHALLGLLGLAVVFVAVYVLTSNTVSERTAKLAGLKTQVAEAQAEANSLAAYTSFQQLAQQRSATVRQIVSSRFDWDKALGELSRVVPADTSLQSLLGTVVPGVSVDGASGAANTGTLRSQIQAPAFEIRGCTRNQDEVAGLISRLRLINDVTRVTLSDSQKGTAAGAVGAANGASAGCSGSWPTFDLIVFFTPIAKAGTEGLGSSTGGAAPAAGGTTPVSSTATTPTASTSTPASTATTSTSTPAAGSTATPTQAANSAVSGSSQPVTATTGASK
jgi:Tfp pilus assembly protein PilN